MYTLNQADIDAYLATKADADVVGTTCLRNQCLLACVLQQKYPNSYASVCCGCAFVDSEQVREEGINVARLSNLFDSLRPSNLIGGYPITKQAWLLAVEAEAQ